MGNPAGMICIDDGLGQKASESRSYAERFFRD